MSKDDLGVFLYYRKDNEDFIRPIILPPKVTVGEIVVVGADYKMRIIWPLGRITEIIPDDNETCCSSCLHQCFSKKVCFNKDSKKDSSFKPDAVSENDFYLGRSTYGIISDFADVARIYLSQYKFDETELSNM
ncbi:hypothetical protein NPIL_490521 [Nephila pilipes]|uniref:DUF5641 domain-containing protein n=1 Tax=Nephila pilipes TaxID=299642 RepID=A0A8X6K3G1_NEPPI|nr:hypothetical protein NPIL_490521 [Nephila pilipes]